MLLEVAQNVRVDLTLSPGQQTQVVTVTEEIPAIDATSATLGGTVSNQSITALPLVTRNFLQLLQLRPGVVDVPGGTGTATVTNGRRQGADVLLIEGVTQFDLATSNVLINGAQQGGSVRRVACGFHSGIQFPTEPSGGIWMERRIGRKRRDQVGHERDSRHSVCLRPQCGVDRCEDVCRHRG